MTRVKKEKWHKGFIESSQSLKSIDRDFYEWHQGRSHYAVWALCIDDAEWNALLSRAREHMQPYCLQGIPRQAHVTLFAIGFTEDEMFDANISAQVVALENSGITPFEIDIGTLNSFSSAPYFEIADPSGALERLRQALSGGLPEDRIEPYTPHLTVGLYNDGYAVRELIQHMQAFAWEQVPALKIDSVQLMQYGTQNIFSPLETLLNVKLDSEQ